ncbi:MAG TPA: DoxX subfamily [Blastocatellia bacterium]|nr:DoxX subfamily [Blastocatellia bacterium]
MSNGAPYHLSPLQQAALIALRTLVGWHFLYEGYYKLALPAWSADGLPLAPWSADGYLRSASGPLARLFQWLLDAGWGGWIDNTVKIGLLLIGLSLMLGLFTRAGCWGAIFFLALFYLLDVPLAGTFEPGSEGAYLIVNKTLIEAAAVLVLLVFNTGAIAGLDLLLARRKRAASAEARTVSAQASGAESAVGAATVLESKKD